MTKERIADLLEAAGAAYYSARDDAAWRTRRDAVVDLIVAEVASTEDAPKRVIAESYRPATDPVAWMSYRPDSGSDLVWTEAEARELVGADGLVTPLYGIELVINLERQVQAYRSGVLKAFDGLCETCRGSASIPDDLRERLAPDDGKLWKCVGCGAEAPGRRRSCACPSGLVYRREGGKTEIEEKA